MTYEEAIQAEWDLIERAKVLALQDTFGMYGVGVTFPDALRLGTNREEAERYYNDRVLAHLEGLRRS